MESGKALQKRQQSSLRQNPPLNSFSKSVLISEKILEGFAKAFRQERSSTPAAVRSNALQIGIAETTPVPTWAKLFQSKEAKQF